MPLKNNRPWTRSLRRRLDILEAAVPKPGGFRRPANHAEWLAVFQDLAKDGMFEREPDFAKAIAEYQAAIEASKKQPPAKQNTTRFCAPNERIDEAFFWLAEMYDRALEGKPGVTEEEFNALARWHDANESRIWAGRNLITAPDGRALTRAEVRHGLSKGPRTMDVTELMEQVRWLRTQFAG